jgi:hypothetical protein
VNPRPPRKTKGGHLFDWGRSVGNATFCQICGLKAMFVARIGMRYQLMDGSVVDDPPPCIEVPKPEIPRRYRPRKGKRKRQKQRL